MNNTLLNNIKNLIPFVERNVLDNLFSWNELESLLNLRPFINDARLHISPNKKRGRGPQVGVSD